MFSRLAKEQQIKADPPTRRIVLKAIAAIGSSAALSGFASARRGVRPRVVVVGGGFGGATAARYLALRGRGEVGVTLVDRNSRFNSCLMSNLVIAGYRKIDDISLSYDELNNHGVKVITGEVTAVAHHKQRIQLGDGTTLPYDRLIVSPGIDFMWNVVGGMADAAAQDAVPHAWSGREQTVNLQKQLQAMANGGVFAIAIPLAPYRCGSAPYERACLVADYFKNHKPRSKVLILDANEEIVSMKELFTKVWQERYADIIDYRNNSELKEVDVATRTAILEFDKVKTDVLNAIPPQRAGQIARQADLINVNKRWCDVNWLTMESTSAPNVHVLGDSVFPSSRMAKSGHVANQQARVAAAAILNIFRGREPNQKPMIASNCFSYVSERDAIHLSGVHAYDHEKRTMQPVPEVFGISKTPGEADGEAAAAWARNLWKDSFGNI